MKFKVRLPDKRDDVNGSQLSGRGIYYFIPTMQSSGYVGMLGTCGVAMVHSCIYTRGTSYIYERVIMFQQDHCELFSIKDAAAEF